LFNVADRPWKAMIAHMIKNQLHIYGVMLGQRPALCTTSRSSAPPPPATASSPIPHATGPIKLDGGSVNWPGTPAEQIASSRVVQGGQSDRGRGIVQTLLG